MSWVVDIYQRIEPNPTSRDLDEGFAARVADPLWFLTRQWQMGEHRGEDAASPVRIDYELALDPFDHARLGPAAGSVPTEAVIEAEPTGWWTVGRRVAIGRRIVDRAAAEGVTLTIGPDLELGPLPPPYDRLDPSGPDGLGLARDRAALGLPDDWFDPASLAAADAWNPATFDHHSEGELVAGGAAMTVERHDGGELGWYSLTTDQSPTSATIAAAPVVPTRLAYPGAPNPRWWALENASVDIGGHAPDRSHFATLLLIEIVTSHSDNWFMFPVQVDVGSLATIANVTVTDSFGERHPVAPPAGWNLFNTEGLSSEQLVFTPTALNPLQGEPVEIVDVAIDEQANVAWAVERRVDGIDLEDPDPGADTTGRTLDATNRQSFDYRTNRPIPTGWHPYLPGRAPGRHLLVQGRLADLTGSTPDLAPAPRATLLSDPAAGAIDNPHEISAAAIPTRGLEINRRYRLTRSTDGSPVLWLQRQAGPRPGWTSTELAFDLLDER